MEDEKETLVNKRRDVKMSIMELLVSMTDFDSRIILTRFHESRIVMEGSKKMADGTGGAAGDSYITAALRSDNFGDTYAYRRVFMKH